MNRAEKVKLLKAVREGLLMPEEIRPAKIYLFYERLPYEGEGWKYKKPDGTNQQMTDAECKAFIQQLNEASDRRERCGLEPDKIICVSYEKGCEPK